MIGHLDKAKNFYASIQDGAEAAAKKIEKILTLMKIDDATNAGAWFLQIMARVYMIIILV